MKKYIILFMLIAFEAINIYSQDTIIITKRTEFIVGDEIDFQVNNILIKDSLIFPDSTNYIVMIENKVIEKPTILKNDKGIKVILTVPDDKSLIGLNKLIQFVKGNNIKAFSLINIYGKKPSHFDSEVNAVLYKGDDFKQIEIRGQNLSFITYVNSRNQDLIFNPTEPFKIVNGLLYISVKASLTAHPVESIEIIFSYLSRESNKPDTVKNIFYIEISDKIKKRIKEINRQVYYKKELENKLIDFTVILDKPIDTLDRFNFLSSEFPFVQNTVSITPVNNISLKIQLTIDGNKLGAGRKYFEIEDKRTKEVFYGYLTIIDEPVIKSVRDISKNTLTYTPYESAEIIIEGENLFLTTFEILDDKESNITYTQSPITDNAIKVVLNFNDNIEIRPHYFQLSRSFSIDGRLQINSIGWHEPINIVQPHKIAELDSIISYFVKDTTIKACTNKNKIIPVAYNKEDIKVLLEGKDIEDAMGPQAISMKATLISEEKDIVGTVDFINDKTGPYSLIGTKLRKYEGSEKSVPWPSIIEDLEDELNIKVRPWSKIIIEVSHNKEFYKNYKGNPDFNRQVFVLKGNFWSNISSTITMPPTLFVWGQKKVENKYENKAQVLPLNVGYGIQWQPRTKKYDRSPFSIGLFVIGLNFLGSEDKDTTKVIVSDTVTKITVVNNNLIEQGSVSAMLLGEVFVFNKEAKVQLPIQVGLGWQIPVNGVKSQWFVVVGFGINYRF